MNFLAHHYWLILPISTLLSVALCLLIIPPAFKFGWVDHPGVRKVHCDSTPLVGGIAIFLAILLVFLVTLLLPGYRFAFDSWQSILLAGALMMLVVGAIDDRRDLSPGIRFLVQILVCLFISSFTGWHLEDFGALFSGSVVGLELIGVPITIFAAIGVINSFNLIDGMDGLSASLFLLAAMGLVGFATSAGFIDMAWFFAVASAAVLGFLLLNGRFPWNDKARLFLGDSGSLMLGLLLSWGFIRLGSGEDRAFMPMTAVWLFAVPLLDTSTLMWRRWREGRSAIQADQNHLHHVFLRAGYSVESTWALIVLLAAVLAGIGVLIELSGLPDSVSFYTFMLVAFSYYFYLKHCWAAQNFLGRHFIHHDFEIDESVARIGKT